MKNLRYFLLLSLHGLYSFAFSQNHHVQFDHIGTAEGLSQSNVLCIMHDSRGFMWFGTRDGLNRYDGYKFTIYKNNPRDKNSVSNNFIMDIAESKNGDLWIATLGGGVCRYDRNKENFTRYQHDARNANSICSGNVNNIVEDEQGKLWIGTEGGLDLFDPLNNKFEHFTNTPNDTSSLSDAFVRYLFEDTHHDLWICTRNGGLNLFNRKTRTFTRFQHDKNDTGSIAGNNVYTMFEDSKHRLWIGTDGEGMDLFDQKNGVFSHFKHDEARANTLPANVVYAISEDPENNIWIGTENGGLSILNYTTRLFTNYKNDEIDRESISNNSIYSIYKDAKNNMWVGTFAGGVDLANRDKIRFSHFKHTAQTNSLSDNHILCISEDSKKNIWIGTDGGGLNLFDPASGNFKHFRHEKNNKQSICGDYVLTACEDTKGNIWIGTWADGITVYNPGNNTFRHFKNNPANPSSLHNNNAWTIFEDKDKNIWVGTFGGGLDLLNSDGKSFTHFQYDKNHSDGISSNNIISIFEDSDGELWIGTDGGGLNLFNKKTRTFSRFLHDEKRNSISNNSLSAFWEDSNKNLWIGTRTGLSQFNKKTRQFTVYTMEDGLPDNTIFGILEDSEKNLWISTNRGISCLSLVTKVVKNYGVSDGLQSNEFKAQASCRSRSGMMYFGGNNGFNRFLPESIHPTAFEPQLVITNFQIFNKEVPIAIDKNDPSPLIKSITETNTIILPYSNSVFSFEYATLNYTVSEKKKYAYMLEEFDKGWNEVGMTRAATYTNLDPGEYLFKVKGLNNDGNWSPNIAKIKLIIKPPYWLTWWFKLAIFLAVSGSVVAFYFFRMSTIKAQKAKLEQRVEEQTRQLIKSANEEQKARREAEQANKELEVKNKEMEQFAYIASHDLQEPLRTTTSFVTLLQKQYQGKFDEKADKYFTFISDASDRMRVLIKNLLDFSRIGNKKELEQVDCDKLLQNVLADLAIVISETGADIQYDRLPVINGYAIELKQLFQNLITNAIKFRKKDTVPEIHISVQKKEDCWQFAIKDNGIGIEETHYEKIFAIFQRLHTRNEYEGSGIGLSHCKKIVELHKGAIWVESTPGLGSTFHFTILDKTKSTI